MMPPTLKALSDNRFKQHSTKNLFVLGALLSLALAGCVSTPNVDLDMSAASRIKRIAIIAVPQPSNVGVINIGGAAGAFGLIGGLTQAAINADHSKEFAAVVNQQKTSPSEALYAAVERSLKEQGFAVTVVRDQKPKLAADGQTVDYSGIRVDADAILFVRHGMFGYMSSPYSLHYEPWVTLTAQLLDAKTKKDLYIKTFCVGYKMQMKNVAFIPADDRYRYRDFDDLMAQSGDAISGLASCDELAAERIGRDLKAR